LIRVFNLKFNGAPNCLWGIKTGRIFKKMKVPAGTEKAVEI